MQAVAMPSRNALHCTLNPCPRQPQYLLSLNPLHHSHEAEEQAVDDQQEDKPEHAGVEEVAPGSPQHSKGQVLLDNNQDHGHDVKHHTLHMEIGEIAQAGEACQGPTKK